MTIEQELKARKIEDEYQRLYLNMAFTFNWIEEHIARLLKKYNLTSHQFNVLRILRGSHGTPLPAYEIQNRMISKSSNVTRIIEKLVAKALVDKKFNESNRRKVEITITEKGIELLSSLDTVVLALHASTYKNITVAEAKTLNELLDKIRQ